MPQTKQSYTPRRKTTDVTIAGECWRPVVTWLSATMTTANSPNILLIEDDAMPGVQQLLSRTRKLTHQDDVRIRLSHHDMDALADQLRFWESCIDELPPTAKQSAPNTGWFQEMAIEMEQALRESFRPPSPNLRLLCQVCHRPVEGAGAATINIKPQAVVVTARHPGCPIPQKGGNPDAT